VVQKKRKKIVRFLVGYMMVILAFYIFYYSGFYERYLNSAFLHFQAKVSYLLLNVLEEPLYLRGTVVSSPKFSYTIIRGCDGLEGLMIFLAAILVFPVAFRLKWKGLLVGTLILFLINHLRIIFLFYVGVHRPDYFEFAHHNVGFILYSTASVLMLLLWVEWIRKNQLRAAA
jgi:exosortase/archaeosortase family protein